MKIKTDGCSCCGVNFSDQDKIAIIRHLAFAIRNNGRDNNIITFNPKIIDNLNCKKSKKLEISSDFINLQGNNTNLCQSCFDILTREMVKIYNKFIFRQEYLNDNNKKMEHTT